VYEVSTHAETSDADWMIVKYNFASRFKANSFSRISSLDASLAAYLGGGGGFCPFPSPLPVWPEVLRPLSPQSDQ
jgi:hypothetical protein